MFPKGSRDIGGDDGTFSAILGLKLHKQHEVEFDTKTIYGSELVKFAVHQVNDLLRVEDVLLDTNHIFVCKNTCKDDKKDYNYCIRNEENRILLYCQHAERWTSTLMMFLRCTHADFGYKAFNDKNREVLSAVGKQCCFRNGTVELMCGTHRLGSIQQSDGGTYKILASDGSERFTLKKDGKGLYDVLAGSKANRKVGEIRQSWAELPLLEDIHIIYGVTLHPDLPLHEKYLIFGSSFLLFYQKYRNWNNQRKFQYICFGQTILLLLLLGGIAAFVMFYK